MHRVDGCSREEKTVMKGTGTLRNLEQMRNLNTPGGWEFPRKNGGVFGNLQPTGLFFGGSIGMGFK